MNNQVTGWFDGITSPRYPGLYQRLKNTHIAYSYWDGQNWYSMNEDMGVAMYYFGKRIRSGMQFLPWRGLAEKPT